MLPILLITRPLPQARLFAREATFACPPHETLIAPLSEIAPLAFDPAVFDGAEGLVLTSANAVPFLPVLGPLPAWCVGPATARAAARAGFRPIDGGGDAAALFARLAGVRPPGPLVHAHGREIARQIAGSVPGVEVRGVAVYEARALSLPVGLLVPGRRIVAPLFSPRAAAIFGGQDGVPAHPDLIPVAISPACAAALPDPLSARAIIAGAPNGAAMLRAVSQALS